MNSLIIIGILIIVVIIIVVAVIGIIKLKSGSKSNENTKSGSKSNENTNVNQNVNSSQNANVNQNVNSSQNANVNQNVNTESGSKSNITPEDIIPDEMEAPKELSQAEILKAEIMKEVLQDQKTDFDNSLSNELNMDLIINNEELNDYFDKHKENQNLNKFTLIVKDNIIPFKFIAPAYNPTNGAHFIYCVTYWILKDKLNEFEKILNDTLNEINLSDHVIKINESDVGVYLLLKTYTNTSTPSYQVERILKNIKPKYDIIYAVNENEDVYTYQGDIAKDVKKFEKIKKSNVKAFNIDAYKCSNDEIMKF